jgi:hypothetical protein
MPVATLIKLGDTGSDVSLLQSRLSSLGFDAGPADGIFGSQTDMAVRKFQQAKGLNVDGVVGAQTWQALGGEPNTSISANSVSGTLVDIGRAAESRFNLTIGECSAAGAPGAWGPVHQVHSPNSLHYAGRAFDACGSDEDMRDFAAWVDANYCTSVAELIHNPNASIKDGEHVDPSFWGDDVWAAHANHVHFGM